MAKLSDVLLTFRDYHFESFVNWIRHCIFWDIIDMCAFKSPVIYKTDVDGLREKKGGTSQPTLLNTIVAMNMTSFNPQFYFVQVQMSGKP